MAHTTNEEEVSRDLREQEQEDRQQREQQQPREEEKAPEFQGGKEPK